MVIDYFDTSAIIAKGGIVDNCYVSHFVISELEEIKNSSTKDESVKAKARQATRALITSQTCKTCNFDLQKIERVRKKHKWLPDNMDGRIIAEAILLREQTNANICFWTADYNMKLFAQTEDFYIHFVTQDCAKNIQEPWSGWGKYYPTEEEMNSLYTQPNFNILNCKTNEFAMIHEGEKLKDILFWNGNSYTKLKYKEMKNPYTQEIIKPRNLQQKMAMHMLQNQDIKVKTLYSSWGGGKTLLALTYALEQIAKGNYQKLVFVRNNIIASDTNDIGFLPGTMIEKMKIWGMCMAAHVGGEMMLDQLLEEGIIEIFPLSHMRGLSIRDSIVIADECENLTTKHITLLMSRIEENSEIIFCGDMAQVDFKRGEKYSGMNHMINSLAGEALFGAVKLIKSERGPVPRLCDKISPPNI